MWFRADFKRNIIIDFRGQDDAQASEWMCDWATRHIHDDVH